MAGPTPGENITSSMQSCAAVLLVVTLFVLIIACVATGDLPECPLPVPMW